jgi:DNA repair protein RAD16
MAMTVTEDGDWCKADEDDCTYKFTTEYAKSSHATCRLCSEKIKKDTVRLGVPVKWGGGEHGYINAWCHLICARSQDGEEVLKSEVWGIEKLKASDQIDVLAELQKKGLPSHIKTIDPNDKNFLKKRTMPPIDQPSKVAMTLMPYQSEGVGWMIRSENSHVRGGVLADEMGMGKTLQAISLILSTRAERKAILKQYKEIIDNDSSNNNNQANEECVDGAESTKKSGCGSSSNKKKKKEKPTEIKKEQKSSVTTPPRRKGGRGKQNVSKKSKKRSKSSDEEYTQDDDDGAFTPQSRKSYTKSKNRSTASKKTKKKKKCKEEAKDENGANLYPELKNALATIRTEDIQEFGPTLVVCPSSAMMQWRDEIYRCASNGSVKVFLYYQNRKKIKPRDLLKYDVVLTTYAVLEYDYRRQVNKQKVSCQYCNKLYLPRKLILHNQYFCGPNSMRTAKQQKTERSRKSALEKAKVTLKITKKKPVTNNKKKRKAKMPTPSAIYKELMEDANREAVPMYVSAKQQKTKDAKKKTPVSSTKAKKGTDEEEKNNSNTSASITTTSKLVARLQDYTTSGPLDHAPSSLSDSSCSLNNSEKTPTRRRRSLRIVAKTSPYFSRNGGKAGSNTDDSKPTSSRKQVKKVYIDDSDEDYNPNEDFLTKSSKKKGKSGLSTKKSVKKGKSNKIEKQRKRKGKKPLESSSEDDSSSSGEDDSSSSDEDGDIDEAEFTDRDGVNLRKSTLHRTKWLRVILDEAHKIKGRTNNTAKAVYALKSTYRWCLTGTPLQNRVSELYALIRFLVLAPHSYYFCKTAGCSCISLYWEFGPKSRKCEQCGCTPMRHYSFFNKMVMNPIKRYGYIGDGRRAMLRLKEDILDVVMLRRTKVERAEDIKLPPLNINIEYLTLDASERDFYECIYKNSRSKFDTYVDKGTLLNNYAHVFQLLSRLRQTLDHPYLVVHGDFEGKKQNLPSKSTGHSDVCGVCGFDILKSRECVLSACHHTFHKSCLDEYTKEFHGDAEEDDANANSLSDTKQKKKRKRGGSSSNKQKKKNNNVENVVTCPVCFVPLTIQMGEVRGLDETNDSSTMVVDDPTKCIICMENERNALLVPCGHIYTCKDCTDVFRKRKNACPLCRASIRKVIVQHKQAGSSSSSSKENKAETAAKSTRAPANNILLGRESIVQQLTMDNFESSAKVEAVVKHVKKLAKTEGNKGIIFSQYNRMIDIVEWRLKDAGYNVVKLVGSMSLKQRSAVLDKFKSDPDIHIIIMSLKAGGEGLNLQEASHVFVLEPWWNPAVELQAIQRAHRIGQTKTVTATRFITKDTIEERMAELQEKKQLVFEGTIDSSALALSQLTTDDLRFLFK